MKIIGEKLTNNEMLQVKGGATCYCGWQGQETYGPFTVLGSDPDQILQYVSSFCLNEGYSQGGGHCTGLPIVWE